MLYMFGDWLFLFASWSLSVPDGKIPVQLKKAKLVYIYPENEWAVWQDHTGLLDKEFKA